MVTAPPQPPPSQSSQPASDTQRRITTNSDTQRKTVTFNDKGERAARIFPAAPAAPVTHPRHAISAMRRRPAAYHRVTPRLTARTGAAPIFTPSQPKTFSSPADPNDAVAAQAAIVISDNPCTLPRSSTVYDWVSSVVPAMYMKFQP